MKSIIEYRGTSIILVAVSMVFFPLVLDGQGNGKILSECIEIALKNNPELKAQEMKIKKVRRERNKQ